MLLSSDVFAINMQAKQHEFVLSESVRMPFQLANSDAVQWLRLLANESVDLVITDPPYESLEKHRAVGTTTRLKNSKAISVF